MDLLRRSLVVVAAVVAAGGAFVVDAGPAHACSCAPEGNVFNALGGADLAFVGEPIDRRVDAVAHDGESYVPPVVWTFQVEVVVKGEIGDTIEVRTGQGGGDCGVDFTDTGRIGVLVHSRDTLTTSICGGTRDADELLAAPRTMPEPTGAGPVHLLVGGRYGDAEIIALDAAGRPLGYGYVPADVRALSVCPGSASFVVAYGYDEVHVELWDLARLERVSELAVIDDPNDVGALDAASSVTCTSADGDVAWLGPGQVYEPALPSRIVRLGDDPVDVSTVGFAGGAVAPTGRAVVIDTAGQVFIQDGDADPEAVVTLDAAAPQPIVAVSPDGATAFVTGNGAAHLVDLTTGTTRTLDAVVDRVANARWTDGGLLVTFDTDAPYATVLDHTGAPVARFDGWVYNGAIDASRTLYVSAYGEGIVRTAPDGGTTTLFAESGYLRDLHVLIDGPEVAPEARERLEEPTSASTVPEPVDDAVAIGTGSSGGGAGWLVALGGAGAAVVMVPFALAWTSRRRARTDEAVE